MRARPSGESCSELPKGARPTPKQNGERPSGWAVRVKYESYRFGGANGADETLVNGSECRRGGRKALQAFGGLWCERECE